MKRGFTLAEILATFTIVGVVAVLVIPIAITHFKEQEYKAGLKKAVSVLNRAISMNIVRDNTTPSDIKSGDLAAMVNYFARSTHVLSANPTGGSFHTVDGMRFQFLTNEGATAALQAGKIGNYKDVITAANARVGSCTDASPCYVVVDVNGEQNPNVYTSVTAKNAEVVPLEAAAKMSDVFYIMITSSKAIPVDGIAADVNYERRQVGKK